jgi:hypothetical protein
VRGGVTHIKVYATMEARGIDAFIPAKAKPPPTDVIPVRRFIRCAEPNRPLSRRQYPASVNQDVPHTDGSTKRELTTASILSTAH